ncbi:MAG: extracellular solute-binding protein [Oscillospiraceae bacterium]|nr:extracellular solute-binding protein [Oscillospiraceae bacterium]
MIYKKSLTVILFITFILLTLVSCQSDKKNNNTIENTDSDGVNQDIASENDTEQGTDKIIPDLPEVNYDGYAFTVLSMTDEKDYERDDFFAEEFTGEIINDAKYQRNLYVEDKYGVSINTVNIGNFSMGNGTSKLKKEIAAGNTSYDAAVLAGYDAANSVTAGLLMDLNSMSPLDLSKPWWDQKANEDLTIKGKMYFTTGDISAAMGAAIWATVFNKQILQDYGIENPYDLVKSGKWTYDKLTELARMVSVDLDGNGIMNQYDRFGFITVDDIMQSMINTVGERCAVINADGEIELSIYNDRTIAAYDKISNLVWDSSTTFQTQRVSDDTDITMFSNNQALFYSGLFRHMLQFRNMETDFGILPMPKLDESQKEYCNPINTWWSLFVCVPTLQEDPERTAVILEALAAESRYTLRPAFYEKSLLGKNTRDEESGEMLDIIFATRVYDFGWYYQIGGLDMGMINIIRNKSGTFASTVEKAMGKVEKDIQNINDLFSEYIK